MKDKSVLQDITIKAISVIFAILLWFYVITEQNPVVTKNVTIPIKPMNLEFLDKNNMVVVQNPNEFKTTLRLKGKSDVLDKIDENTLLAYADFEGCKDKGENRLTIIVNGLPEGAVIAWRTPDYLKVTLEQKVSVQRAVNVNILGNPSQGLAAMTAVVSPAEVVLSGAESQINKIKTVKVDLDIAGAGTAVKKSLPVILLDESGKEVTNVEVNPENVNVSIPIENTKRVTVQADFSGKPSDGYTASSVTVFPREIILTGSQAALDSINFVKTEKIDITDATADIDKSVNLVIPPGVELANKSEKVRVYIDIEKIISKQLSLNSVEYRNLPPGFEVQSSPVSLQAVIRGPESLVNDAWHNISFYMDLRHAVEGTNTLSIMWEKSPQLEIVDLTPSQADVVLKKTQ